MKINWYKIVVEAIIITIAASAFGLAYYLIVDKPGENGEGGDTHMLAEDEFVPIYYEQVKALIDKPGVVIVDARTPENYEKGTIDGAVNIFPYIDEAEKFDKLVSLADHQLIIVFCDGGECDLSHEIARSLLDLEFGPVFLYQGGWEDWSKRENPDEN